MEFWVPILEIAFNDFGPTEKVHCTAGQNEILGGQNSL